jgi:hypothetical protein
MPKINLDWVTNQFAKINIHKGTGLAIIELLKAWEKLDIKKPETAKTVLDVFHELAQGHAIVKDDDFTWVQARRGDIKVRDVVRVKADAYNIEDIAYLHNGRIGVVIAIRSGDIIVDITDEQEPELKGVHYAPENLEKRVSQ